MKFTQINKSIKQQKTVTLLDTQIVTIQKLADDKYEGDFSQMLRHIIKSELLNKVKN